MLVMIKCNYIKIRFFFFSIQNVDSVRSCVAVFPERFPHILYFPVGSTTFPYSKPPTLLFTFPLSLHLLKLRSRLQRSSPAVLGSYMNVCGSREFELGGFSGFPIFVPFLFADVYFPHTAHQARAPDRPLPRQDPVPRSRRRHRRAAPWCSHHTGRDAGGMSSRACQLSLLFSFLNLYFLYV